MKKFKYTIIALLVLISTACDHNLEETPYSVLSPQNFYQTESDAEAAVIAGYSTLTVGYEYYQQAFNIYVGGLDDTQQGRNNSWSKMAKFAFDASAKEVEGLWRKMYQSINVCNTAIDNIANIDMDEAKKNSLIGEARFLRALNYFNLVRLWGGVPIEITETKDLADAYKSRSSVKDVYDVIVDDLKFAEANINQVSKGRATEGAAKSLLAKVYLTMAGEEGPNKGETSMYQLARDKAAEVMDMGYALQSDFAAIFDVNNEGNSEIIFELEFSRSIDGQGSRIVQLHGGWDLTQIKEYFDNPIGFNNGWGIMYASHKWCRETDTLDYRRGVTVVAEATRRNGTEWTYNSRNWGAPIIKWKDPLATGFDSHENNLILLRYADVLLIFAEAENEINPLSDEANAALEQVRKRARDADGQNLTGVPADLTGSLSSKEEFTQAIIDERYIEIAFENAERWFDLKRHGLVQQEVYEANLQPITYFQGMELFPIPANEISRNENLAQNPGW